MTEQLLAEIETLKADLYRVTAERNKERNLSDYWYDHWEKEMIKKERLSAIAERRRKRLIETEADLARVASERDYLKKRERYFANLLGVADGGQYQADWESRINALRARVSVLEGALREVVKSLESHSPEEQFDGCIQDTECWEKDRELIDRARKAMEGGK